MEQQPPLRIARRRVLGREHAAIDGEIPGQVVRLADEEIHESAEGAGHAAHRRELLAQQIEYGGAGCLLGTAEHSHPASELAAALERVDEIPLRGARRGEIGIDGDRPPQATGLADLGNLEIGGNEPAAVARCAAANDAAILNLEAAAIDLPAQGLDDER